MSRKSKNKGKKTVNLITHSDSKSPISEQYRSLRTNIQFAQIDKEIKSMVVTSPEPSDGKSTTAANLAVVLSQQEKKVLLVDADLRKPSIHYAFNISNINGLTNVLSKAVTLEDAITKTHVPNLEILTSGPIPPNPSELLNSNYMELIIKKLNDSYDYIVFDTPPILAVTDPQIIANKCDGVILVVASGKTTKEKAVKAKDLLEKSKSPLLGVVVNGVESEKDSYYYQYG